jgi:pimeloyl-ACP methyl ester carboxylesterase
VYYYAKGIFKSMQATGKRLGHRAAKLAGSTAGRAILDAAIVARPSQLSPEQARGDATAFFRAADALNEVLAKPIRFEETVPADVPVTIGWGTKDRLLPISQASVARKHIPQARFVLLPGCGHVPMTDDPELVARVLLEGSGG